ncbi:MAG TPA: MATE family efflux transporter [Rhodocyclaceae bacterium]|nr:MATE family efflux transporter [Rhodocyclaceae bacterium]
MKSLNFRSHFSNIFQIAWPVLVSQLALTGYGVLDTVMAGRLGAVELAGVGIGAVISLTIMVTCSGVLLALTPLIAHLHGADKHEDVGEEVRQSLWVALGVTIIAMLLMQFPEPILKLAAMPADVEQHARAYLIANSWAAPGLMVFRVFTGLSTGIGEPRAAMRFYLLGLVLKLPLNFLLLPHFGGAGCAWATAIVNTVNAVLAWGWGAYTGRYRDFHVFARFSAPRWPAIREFLKLGLPIGASFLIDISAFASMALFIARFGPATSGAHQIAANLTSFTYMLPMSLGIGASVLSGRALGGGDPALARRVGSVCLIAAVGLGLITSALLFLGAPLLAHAYTNDPSVYPIAVTLIKFVALYHIADALQASTINVLRGFKRTTVPMVVYAVALWGVGLGGGYWLGITHGLGAPGFWLGGAVSLAIAGVSVTIYFLRISRVPDQAAHPA